jgi:hypothetical protein
MSPDVKTIIETLQEDVIWVHAKWKVFRQLFGTSEKRIAILNDFAPDFFQIVHDGLIYDILLAMSRLTDSAESFKKGKSGFMQQDLGELWKKVDCSSVT